MAVELILLEDVAGLGKIGDKVRAADGYARNYLLPRKLAASLNAGTLRSLEAKKLRLQQEYTERVNVAKAMADKIGQITVSIAMQAGDDEKLYGSVTNHQIVDALVAQGLTVEKTAVQMPEHFKTLGNYTVEIKLHTEVQATLKVAVVRS